MFYRDFNNQTIITLHYTYLYFNIKLKRHTPSSKKRIIIKLNSCFISFFIFCSSLFHYWHTSVVLIYCLVHHVSWLHFAALIMFSTFSVNFKLCSCFALFFNSFYEFLPVCFPSMLNSTQDSIPNVMFLVIKKNYGFFSINFLLLTFFISQP